MNYIVISDYPYYTSKDFLPDLPHAEAFWPSRDNLLNSRIYTLTSYKETILEDRTNINYTIDTQTRIQKFPRHRPDIPRQTYPTSITPH